MQSMLKDKSIEGGYERVRRPMRLANICPIYPRRHLTKRNNNEYVYPYLLRGMQINRSNQVWETDITYVPIAKGFMYLTAITDVYSRYIVGWRLSNTLGAESCLEVLRNATSQYGKPGIINSDQGEVNLLAGSMWHI